jgi:hypothetical protein
VRALIVVAALARAAAAEPWTVPERAARPASVEGKDELDVAGTLSMMGSGHTIAMTQRLAWRADGDRITLGAIDSQRVQDGRAERDDDATVRAQVARSLAFERGVAAALIGRRFERDVPVAIDPAPLRALAVGGEVELDRLVVTWTGTRGDVARFRIYASFALTGAFGGRATIAGGLDLDAVHGVLVDVRLAAIMTTERGAFLDARATAHLHRDVTGSAPAGRPAP